MRILEVSGLDVGGAYTATKRLANALTELGQEVEMISPSSNSDGINKLVSRVGSKADYELQKISRAPLTTSFFRNFGTAPFFKNLVERTSINDVIHFQWIAGHFSQQFKEVVESRNCIFTLHDMHMATSICHHTFGCRNYLTDCSNCPQTIRPMHGIVKHEKQNRNDFLTRVKAQTLVFPSHWLKRMYEKSASFDKHKLIVIPNVVPEKIFFPMPYVKDPSSDSTEVNIGILGSNYDPSKGAQMAATIAQNCLSFENVNIRFQIFGSAHRKLPQHLCELLPPGSSEQEVAQKMRECDLFIYMSEADNLPSIVLELQMSGVPVVALDCGGVSECIQDERSGLLVNNYSEAIRAVKKLVDNHALRREMSRRSRLWSESLFSSEVVSAKYLKAINSLPQ